MRCDDCDLGAEQSHIQRAFTEDTHSNCSKTGIVLTNLLGLSAYSSRLFSLRSAADSGSGSRVIAQKHLLLRNQQRKTNQHPRNLILTIASLILNASEASYLNPAPRALSSFTFPFMSLFFRTSKLTVSSTFRSSIPTASTTIGNNFVRNFSSSTIKMGVHNLSTKAEFSSALKDNNIVVLDAFATWCGPCKAIAPQVVKFSEEFPSAHFVKIDVDEVPDVAQELGIRAMPTFLIFKGEEKIAEVVGANPKALQAAIAKAVTEAKA
ncbi:thioredoxin [Phlyctema vagabunda]|uniref:Thioredoxin n=1 Tax=Phlyctema vagabunda TaxID=108571 RepID=A0ABR4P8X9_9HELO